MKRNAVVSLVLGYLGTYYKFFTEPMTVMERICAAFGIGLIVFWMISKEEGRKAYER